MTPELVLGAVERAAEHGLDTKHIEEPGADLRGLNPARLATARQRQLSLHECGDGGKGAALIFVQAHEIRRRQRRFAAPVAVNRVEHHQAVRLVEIERAQQDPVDDAEDGRRQADAERERHDGREGESGTSEQRAHSVP